MDDRVYLKQLRAGRDFARDDSVAASMANFVYVVGDNVTRDCMIVDPAWDVASILDVVAADDMNVVGALVTHYHPDHIGGPLFGHDVEGLSKLMSLKPVPVHVHAAEAHGVRIMSGVSTSDLVKHDGGDTIKIGDVEITCLHTPGHTPGSQCFKCGDALIAGDTLFLQGCGRVDFPGGDADEMYRTLTQRFSTLSDETILYPGHHYSAETHAPLGVVRQTNHYLKVPDLASWRRLMGV